MAKYTYEFKRKVVEDYLNGKGGYGYLAKTYDIKNSETIRKWVNAYQKLGDEGLLRSRRKKEYSVAFKLEVVQSYLTSEMSYQSLANHYGINNPSMITRWVLDYQKLGIDGLTPKRRGRSPNVSKEENKKKSRPITQDDTQRLKELEEENYKLRMENDILKEFRRLRLEKMKRQTKNSQE